MTPRANETQGASAGRRKCRLHPHWADGGASNLQQSATDRHNRYGAGHVPPTRGRQGCDSAESRPRPDSPEPTMPRLSAATITLTAEKENELQRLTRAHKTRGRSWSNCARLWSCGARAFRMASPLAQGCAGTGRRCGWLCSGAAGDRAARRPAVCCRTGRTSLTDQGWW